MASAIDARAEEARRRHAIALVARCGRFGDVHATRRLALAIHFAVFLGADLEDVAIAARLETSALRELLEAPIPSGPRPVPRPEPKPHDPAVLLRQAMFMVEWCAVNVTEAEATGQPDAVIANEWRRVETSIRFAVGYGADRDELAHLVGIEVGRLDAIIDRRGG